MRRAGRLAVVAGLLVSFMLVGASPAAACLYMGACEEVELNDGATTLRLSSEQAGRTVTRDPVEAASYDWRLLPPCILAAELGDSPGFCAADAQLCPPEPGRVIQYLIVQRRPVVRVDGTAVVDVPAGFAPGQPIGNWLTLREGCIDITELNPPPSPGEVFSYFERLPLPQLQTRHQPPGNGLAGLPVVFHTDSPTTQRFTVDVRGYSVVIDARAQRYTWHTGDGPPITSTDPGRPYPGHAAEHEYDSGTYTSRLTVTWGATYTVDGSAPADVPGTTTTEGPPVTFTVLEARPVLTDPHD
jgi:hypothetical protein